MKEFIKQIEDFIFQNRIRTGIIAIIVVILIFLGLNFFGSKTSPQQYQTSQATKGTLVVFVSESGQIVSTGSLPVSTLASGVVSKVLVKNGDTVSQGQEIMDIIPDQTTVQNQTQALASYENAVNSYNTAVSAKTMAQATLEKDRASVISASSAV